MLWGKDLKLVSKMQKFYSDKDLETFQYLSREFRKLGFKRRQCRNQAWLFFRKSGDCYKFTIFYTPLFKEVNGGFMLGLSSSHPQYEDVRDVFNFWIGVT